MGYIELYDSDIFDLVNIGKKETSFDPNRGDYIRVEILNDNNNVILGSAYSNRLLLKYPNTENHYLGSYHYHPENNMGFCTGDEHTSTSTTNLLPIPVNDDNVLPNPITSDIALKKQVEIFKDDKGEIYIKPNEILKLFKMDRGKYNIRIHFHRSIKSDIGNLLNLMQNNLIENGNFFAGLEATQTGDLDRSTGKNHFIIKKNPGLGDYVLEQSGLENAQGILENEYIMRVTGIETNSSYVFSCWVAWDDNFNGDLGIASFSNVSLSSTDPLNTRTDGFVTIDKTDLGGSYFLDDESDRILKTKELDGLTWYRLYSFVQTDEIADMGSMLVHVGSNFGQFSPSTNPLGKRYFTDIRMVKVDGLDESIVGEYLSSLAAETYSDDVVDSGYNTTTTSENTEEQIGPDGDDNIGGETTANSDDYVYDSPDAGDVIDDMVGGG